MHRDHDRRLHGFAREMRNKPSEAEKRVWWIVRDKRLGYRFKRQVPMLGYIVDFACMSEKLIVEVDGQQHGEEDARAYDAVRTKVLNDAGYRVLRFWASFVVKEERAVAQTILRELQSCGGEPANTEATPTLTLPRSTGGGDRSTGGGDQRTV